MSQGFPRFLVEVISKSKSKKSGSYGASWSPRMFHERISIGCPFNTNVPLQKNSFSMKVVESHGPSNYHPSQSRR